MLDIKQIGETPLHLAVMFDDLVSVKYLVETKGFDVNCRSLFWDFSCGFKSPTTLKKSKYESLAYYGEYPLTWAACFANKDIYAYLIQKGADPNLKGIINVYNL